MTANCTNFDWSIAANIATVLAALSAPLLAWWGLRAAAKLNAQATESGLLMALMDQYASQVMVDDLRVLVSWKKDKGDDFAGEWRAAFDRGETRPRKHPRASTSSPDFVETYMPLLLWLFIPTRLTGDHNRMVAETVPHDLGPKRKPIHPGTVLREDVLPAIRMKQTEFARRLGGVAPDRIDELLLEKRGLSPEIGHDHGIERGGHRSSPPR